VESPSPQTTRPHSEAQTPGVEPEAPVERPRLLFFYSPVSGRCRRTEAYIAQVLQRRHNHETFDLYRIPVDRRPDLAERFRIDSVPAILVVEDRKVKLRISSPGGARELERQLKPWLR
jgi:thioredoxin-like negative regulator of GroEL